MKWKLQPESSGRYACYSITDTDDAMSALREIFPGAECNRGNFVLFSTSGVHGSCATIEDVEAATDQDDDGAVTFLIVKPRVLVTQYGNVYPKTPEDFAFLKLLRANSKAAVASIGEPD